MPTQIRTPPLRRLSDDELLRTEFRYRDPEHIPGLNPAVPDPDAHPTIVGYYDETPAGGRKANPNTPMIRCCHCGLRRHWKGYVVRDDRDQLFIIGAQNCGHDHYGGDRFQDAENLFRQDLERQKALKRWRNMLSLLPALTDDVDALLTSEALRVLDLKRGEIERASPEGFRALMQNHRSGRPMVEVREIRDYAEETRRDQQYQRALEAYEKLSPRERRRRRDDGLKPQPDNSPIIVRVTEELGVLMGAGFLADSGDVRSAAIALRKTIEAIRALDTAAVQKAWVTNLNRLLRELTDNTKRVWDAHVEVAFVRVFFEPANLDRIERWSRPFARFSYKALDSGLIVEDANRGRTRIEGLGDVSLPATPAIDGMQYRTEDFLPMTIDEVQ